MWRKLGIVWNCRKREQLTFSSSSSKKQLWCVEMKVSWLQLHYMHDLALCPFLPVVDVVFVGFCCWSNRTCLMYDVCSRFRSIVRLFKLFGLDINVNIAGSLGCFWPPDEGADAIDQTTLGRNNNSFVIIVLSKRPLAQLPLVILNSFSVRCYKATSSLQSEMNLLVSNLVPSDDKKYYFVNCRVCN